MKNHRPPLATALLLAPLLLSATSHAASGDAAFNRLADSYRGTQLQAAAWVNPLAPAATGETVATSADTQFMRAIAYYTRDMLDRAGWVNPYAPDNHYASGNYLVAVRVGDGVTLTARA